jgi:hypothetical protein
MQSGIKNWRAGENPYSFTFANEHLPNIYVDAYYFNGYNYQSMSRYICFDYKKNDLTLTAEFDKDTYKPGEVCQITVTAKDKNGNPKEANVNLGIVDEALFALQDYSVNTLTSLFRNISSGLRFAAATHRYSTPSADLPPVEYDSGGSPGSGGIYIRETFKDTATFATIKTNSQGKAVYIFNLPDNITSWRLTMSGISNDFYAGNSVQTIIVTSPMFLTYSLNDEFLTGDKPVVGVNVYGTSLKGGEKVTFEVWDVANPGIKRTASGFAFERVNIPLWEMASEGAKALIIKASVAGGTSDAVKHNYQVMKTYRTVEVADYTDANPNAAFDVPAKGFISITFTDKGRGAFLSQLLGFRYIYGDRIENLLVRREANKILKEYFPGLCLYYGKDSFDVQQYQRGDGGLAILPHAYSDLETTVKTMPYVMDEMNISLLKKYLYNAYNGSNNENKMAALYGLAMLYEPVLLELDNYSLLDDVSASNAVYIALGYCALGETETASRIYDERVAPRLEK